MATTDTTQPPGVIGPVSPTPNAPGAPDRLTGDDGWNHLMFAYFKTMPNALWHARRNRRAIRNLTGVR